MKQLTKPMRYWLLTLADNLEGEATVVPKNTAKALLQRGLIRFERHHLTFLEAYVITDAGLELAVTL